jgi:CubicO group peptidase (beta-lactamase class C family)
MGATGRTRMIGGALMVLPGLVFAATVAAQEPTCGNGEIAAGGACFRVAGIEAIVRETMAEKGIKAALVGITTGGGAPVLMAWGESMTGVPATPDMHFRNGAVAIAYMGTVLLQLRDQGVLDLDDGLATWFPDYPRADRITLEMLINGTSGYADYVTDDGFLKAFYADPFRHWTPDELIAIGLGREMACDPGACWSYAHTNFLILGKVLEAASGRPLASLIRDGILDPLGLEGTRSEGTAIIPEPVLHAFDAERGRYEESTFWSPSWTLAEGAIMTSTVADILTSAEAIGEGRLVSPDGHALQMAPLTAGFPPWNERQFYGMGVFVIDGWLLQNPSFSGYAATMAYLPSRKLAIVTSTTMLETAPQDGNHSTDLLKAIAAHLAPEAPM